MIPTALALGVPLLALLFTGKKRKRDPVDFPKGGTALLVFAGMSDEFYSEVLKTLDTYATINNWALGSDLRVNVTFDTGGGWWLPLDQWGGDQGDGSDGFGAHGNGPLKSQTIAPDTQFLG
jgi:hypothetical protein